MSVAHENAVRSKYIRHPALCQYIEILQGQASRLAVVSEHYSQSLQDVLQAGGQPSGFEAPFLRASAEQLLAGVAALHAAGIVHQRLAADNVLVCGARDDGSPVLKLADYGMGHITEGGRLAQCPLPHPAYLAPERVAYGPDLWPNDRAAVRRCVLADIWSCGVILAECCEGSLPPPLRGKPSEVLTGVLSLARQRTSAQRNSAKGADRVWPAGHGTRFERLSANLQQLIEAMLQPQAEQRPDTKMAQSQLFGVPYSQSETEAAQSTALRCIKLKPITSVPPPPPVPVSGSFSTHNVSRSSAIRRDDTRATRLRGLCEEFFEWKSSGGSDRTPTEVESILPPEACRSGSDPALAVFPMLSLRDFKYIHSVRSLLLFGAGL